MGAHPSHRIPATYMQRGATPPTPPRQQLLRGPTEGRRRCSIHVLVVRTRTCTDDENLHCDGDDCDGCQPLISTPPSAPHRCASASHPAHLSSHGRRRQRTALRSRRILGAPLRTTTSAASCCKKSGKTSTARRRPTARRSRRTRGTQARTSTSEEWDEWADYEDENAEFMGRRQGQGQRPAQGRDGRRSSKQEGNGQAEAQGRPRRLVE